MLDIPADQGLTQCVFGQKSALWGEGFTQKPIVVQILRILNVGVPQQSAAVDNSESEEELSNGEEQQERFENKYLEACDQVAINQQRDEQLKAKDRRANGTNRLFKYLMTDGRTQVIALEAQPLHCIQLERTLPGSKLLFIGPIEVRRGIWLLK